MVKFEIGAFLYAQLESATFMLWRMFCVLHILSRAVCTILSDFGSNSDQDQFCLKHLELYSSDYILNEVRRFLERSEQRVCQAGGLNRSWTKASVPLTLL